MSRIAKPIQGGGLSTITNTTTLQSRPSKIGRKESSSPSKKQTRFSSSPSLSAQDGESVPTNADAPTPQRRSLIHAAGHLPRETAHLSTSSADDLSETDTTARFSPSSKTSTPRSSWSRSPTQDSNNNNNKSGKKSSLVPGALAVGRRVTVPSMGLTGTLRFLGETSFKSGTWAGIELDVVGSGKNDGCVQGVRYFSCPPQTGLFILASKVVPEKRRSIQPAVTTTITNSNGNQTNESLILQQQQQQQQQQQILSATAITTTKRPSRQPVPTRTKSTVVSKRSKTLPPPPQKLTPSKTTVTRTSKKPSRPSRFSLPQQHPPTPPLPASVKRSSPDVSSRAEQQPQPQPPTPENNVDRSSATPPHTETPVEKPRMVPEEELLSIYELLERSQQEKDKLMEQMKSKEAAWERLVSTKESYALRIQEKEEEISRLQHSLEESRKRFEEQQLLLSERDEIIAKNLKEDAVIEQYQRRIEKLENMIEELTAKANETAEHHESKLKDHQGQVEQLRRALADRETLSATLEKECEELRTAGLEAIGAYEASVNQLKREKEELLEEKEAEIRQLSKALEDLKRRSLMLDDDQVDFSNEYADEWHDQRRRLEEQLEIATSELENERSQVRAMEAEADKLKAEIQRLHMASLSSEERLAALQRELEQELLDKRRLMEEADAAFEAQAKAEDENYQLKMARVKSERELAEAMERIAILEKQQQQLPDTSSVEVEELKHRLAAAEERNKVLTQENKQLKEVCKDREQECARLMDELLALENADAEDGGSDSIALRRQIEKLKEELDAERRRYTDLELEKQKEISHLNKELAELESLVESRVFGEGDMEQELENERKKVARLEKEIEDLKKSRPAQQNQRISGKDEMEPFCEICEKPGHDILNCTVLQSSLPPRPGKNSMYCANCDQYDVHSTEDCPNQDETF